MSVVYDSPGWDAFHSSGRHGRVLDEIRMKVYGDDYAPALDANSMITISELRWCIDRLAPLPGNMVLDVCCGSGGPGAWLAQHAGIRRVATDISLNAVISAAAHPLATGFAVGFFVADAARLPVRSGRFAGAFCLDSLQCIPAKGDVLRGVAEALEPGGRLVVTTRELRPGAVIAPFGRATFVTDHRLLFESAGLEITDLHEPDGWQTRHTAYYAAVVEAGDRLIDELGPAFRPSVDEAVRAADLTTAMRRVLIAATKP